MGLDGAVQSFEGTVANGIVGHLVGVVVEDAFGDGNAVVNEASRGVFGLGDGSLPNSTAR